MPLFEINGRRILFIHVPKNAGTSLTSLLGRYSEVRLDQKLAIYGKSFRMRHLHGTMLEQMLFPGMVDYAFMVVRNPLSRVMSEYFYQRRPGAGGLRWQRLSSFDAWLEYSLWRSGLDASYWENHFRPQNEFECLGCEVFRLEDGLSAISRRIGEVTGVSIEDAPNLNSQSHSQFPFKMSNNARERIMLHYRADFERYRYDGSAATGI